MPLFLVHQGRLRRPGLSVLCRLGALLILVSAHGAPTAVAAQQAEAPAVAETAPGQPPVVGGVALEATTAAGWPIYYDRDVPPAAVAQAATALEQMLADVPRLTGLPPFRTPLAVYLLADDERFRLALAEVGGVRTELVANEVGGYTIERDGRMLVFFTDLSASSPAGVTLGFAHELAHLAVREASERKPVPQWFNEGYADWIATAALRERFPEQADAFEAFNRALVASAILSGHGLIPWADLVTRTRFSQAGIQGFIGLAYAQSTLFVDWLAQRHAKAGLAQFLLAIASQPSVTQAFGQAMGPFTPQAEAFAASVADLANRLGPGLHRLSQRVEVGRAVYFAVVGGASGETVTVEVETDGAPTQRRERTLDETGFLPIYLDEAAMAQPGRRLVRVTSASLGVLESEVVVGAEVQPAPAPRPAPVQLPTRRRLRQTHSVTGCAACLPGSWGGMSAA